MRTVVVAAFVVGGSLVVETIASGHANASSPKVLNANRMSPFRIETGLA